MFYTVALTKRNGFGGKKKITILHKLHIYLIYSHSQDMMYMLARLMDAYEHQLASSKLQTQ